ncbi:MAG: ATP-binding protein [Verrucomicrobia bacterium]|nr:ATP-binding protein [Verrucomicrobiota bacterium]
MIQLPGLLAPETLLAECVARGPLLDTLVGLVRGNAPGKPPQHVLLVGGRGLGKTTMLWALARRVESDGKLRSQWLPLVLSTASHRVGDLAGFWLEALRRWHEATGATEEEFERLLAQPEAELEASARHALLERIDRSGRRALLLVDEMNDLLAAFDGRAQQRLREFLLRDPRVVWVGTAGEQFEEVAHVDQPLFDLFRVFPLAPLTPAETVKSWQALARIHGSARLFRSAEHGTGWGPALHLLTAGRPRLLKLAFRASVEHPRLDLQALLWSLLDAAAPEFEAAMAALSAQQQRVYAAVALAWDPVGTAQLAARTRLASNLVSAVLKELTRRGVIVETQPPGGRKSYLLADRPANLHYLLRHGGAARVRLEEFVQVLGALHPAHGESKLGSPRDVGSNSRKSAAPAAAAVIASTQRVRAAADAPIRLSAALLAHARLTTVAEAVDALAALPGPPRCATLADAFRAHADVDHLHRLAPERRAVVLELLGLLPPRAAGEVRP